VQCIVPSKEKVQNQCNNNLTFTLSILSLTLLKKIMSLAITAERKKKGSKMTFFCQMVQKWQSMSQL